jgi:hypothetical protein
VLFPVFNLKVSDLFWQDGEAEEKAKDPGAAVALGAALLVRLLVPAWVVNATSLPISAIVLPHVRPPTPKTSAQQVAAWPYGSKGILRVLASQIVPQHAPLLQPASLTTLQPEAAPGEGLRNADALMSAANALATMRVLQSGYEIK